jgi:hypothetical protein
VMAPILSRMEPHQALVNSLPFEPSGESS